MFEEGNLLLFTAGIYIHIPFCLRKCFYCDFYSEATNDEHVRKGYTRALLKEIGFYGAKYGKTFIADTVFFGGGTPSLMEPELIEKILRMLKKNFFIAQDSEIKAEKEFEIYRKREMDLLESDFDREIKRLKNNDMTK